MYVTHQAESSYIDLIATFRHFDNFIDAGACGMDVEYVLRSKLLVYVLFHLFVSCFNVDVRPDNNNNNQLIYF